MAFQSKHGRHNTLAPPLTLAPIIVLCHQCALRQVCGALCVALRVVLYLLCASWRAAWRRRRRDTCSEGRPAADRLANCRFSPSLLSARLACPGDVVRPIVAVVRRTDRITIGNCEVFKSLLAGVTILALIVTTEDMQVGGLWALFVISQRLTSSGDIGR